MYTYTGRLELFLRKLFNNKKLNALRKSAKTSKIVTIEFCEITRVSGKIVGAYNNGFQDEKGPVVTGQTVIIERSDGSHELVYVEDIQTIFAGKRGE